jgi:gamma-glutamyltranspeptidase / glutathione hydrolase
MNPRGTDPNRTSPESRPAHAPQGAGNQAVSRRNLLARAGQLAGAAALAGGVDGALGTTRIASAYQLGPGTHVQAVVSSHTLATDAGIETLAAGGTAADAAIAVAAALSVVEPWFSSALGGGTWALYFDTDDGEVTSLDGVGPVGSNATREDYAERAGIDGIHQSVVPGAWDGWMLWLERYGRLDLGEVLAPAIRIAREGYPVSPEMAYWLGLEAEFIANDADAARTYLAQGSIPGAGETVRQPEMANTFAALADAYAGASGNSRAAGVQAARDYFYRGPLAEAIVAASDRGGGYLTLPDFGRFEAEIVAPLAIDYRDGITVFENPPNSQGITMLLALNILKGYDFSGVDVLDPDVIHVQVEALKLAFADRHWYVGDPDRLDVPVEELLSEEYAARQRGRINFNRALAWPIAGGLADPSPSHTTTFHVVDRFGNAAAVTTSLGAQFRVIGETGIHINNRMRMISVEPGNANELTPGFKVRHTANPYLALRDGRPFILGGNTGVDTQPQGQMQQVISVVEFGLDAQAAIDKPRFVSTAWPAGSFPWEAGNQLQMESGFPESTIEALAAKGHDVVIGQGVFGSANMIVVAPDGTSADVGAESRNGVSAGRVVPTKP